jgi:hypothetical protein
MWTVDDVKATISGVRGQYGYGFNIIDSRGQGRLLLYLSYETREGADTARKLVVQAIGKAIDIR